MNVSNVVKGFTFALGSTLLISYIMVSAFAGRFEALQDEEALFYIFINAPSEELMFRFAVPLVLMYVFKCGYLSAGIMSSVLFGVAHYWSYEANVFMMVIAIMGGIIYALTVYFFSQKEPFNFDDGLLAAMLAHAGYNSVITYCSESIFFIGLACLLVFAILHFLVKGMEE